MSYRDVEDLILKTLRTLISDGTGVAESNIWLKRPDGEFVNQADGPNNANQSSTQFPAIGISYLSDARINYNNYGPSYSVDNGDDTSTLYSPLGEIDLHLAVSIFSTSKKEKRQLVTDCYYTLLDNKLVQIDNDTIDDSEEYFRIRVYAKREVNDELPYHDIVLIRVNGRILKETTDYTVDTITVNTTIGTDAI